jgi:hypothetical protein
MTSNARVSGEFQGGRIGMHANVACGRANHDLPQSLLAGMVTQHVAPDIPRRPIVVSSRPKGRSQVRKPAENRTAQIRTAAIMEPTTPSHSL